MYQALYRKWRPMSFDDVVSQPHITTTLKNQIKSGKTAHAYLFTGSRGTGKTTCARILQRLSIALTHMTVSHALNVRYAKTLTTALFPILSRLTLLQILK